MQFTLFSLVRRNLQPLKKVESDYKGHRSLRMQTTVKPCCQLSHSYNCMVGNLYVPRWSVITNENPLFADHLIAIMVGVLVQSICFPLTVDSESKVCSKRSGNTKGEVKMMYSLQTSPMRVRSFSGLRGTEAIDNKLVKRGHDFHSKVAAATHVRRAKPSQHFPKAILERFTEKAFKVIMLAQDEARRLGYNFVGAKRKLSKL